MIDYTDDVRGVIIGGSYWGWQIFYDGRPQSQRQCADSKEEAIERGRAEVARVKAECAKVLWLIYPLDAWEIRIWAPLV